MSGNIIFFGHSACPSVPDGSTLTEPSMRTLHEKLAVLGYESQPVAWKKEIEKLLKRVWTPRS